MAIKIVDITDSCQQQALTNEMSCHTLLRNLGGHPNVLTCISSFVATPQAAIVMEAGLLDLARLQIAVGFSLPPHVAIDYALGITSGLAFIHDGAIVHRDLKPSNVILCYSPFMPSRLVPKIADFGSSLCLSPQAGSLRTLNVGTACYRAPEVFAAYYRQTAAANVGGSAPMRDADGLRYSFAADVWSLGCVLGELLHGRVLFQHPSGTDGGILSAIVAQIGPPPPTPNAVWHMCTADTPRSAARQASQKMLLLLRV